MRLKLVVITSVLAALIGAGASIGIILFIFPSLRTAWTPGPLLIAVLLLPIAAVLFGSIFVYRHTARRRKLQAFFTAVLSLFLTLCFFLLTSFFTGHLKSTQPPPPAGPKATK